MLTSSGIWYDPDALRHVDVSIGDAAHSVALINRFLGHTRRPWSVGQHSLLVCFICPAEMALDGLCHDLHEAYVGDVPSPLKRREGMRWFRSNEDAASAVVRVALGAAAIEPAVVRAADRLALHAEMRWLMRSGQHRDRVMAGLDAAGLRATVREAAGVHSSDRIKKALLELSGLSWRQVELEVRRQHAHLRAAKGHVRRDAASRQ